LERRRFEVREVDEGVTAYYYLDVLQTDEDIEDEVLESDPRSSAGSKRRGGRLGRD
jgi:hypothetical protein